jgi:uncharacterized protein
MQFDALKSQVIGLLKEGLPAMLTYHSVGHTEDVLAAAERLGQAEGLSDDSLLLLRTAALLHDTGFLRTALHHEEASVRIAESLLPAYGYSAGQIAQVSQMILATRIPQSPHDALSAILCDADLDYLGRDDYASIAKLLYSEFLHQGVVKDEEEWLAMQLRFLQGHQYFTQTAIRTREVRKQLTLQQLTQR